MVKIRLTKEFRFEMAHALYNYDGLCKNIHGHSYILQVTVIGEPITESNNPKLGMVMDFGELKTIVNREIVSKLDHAVVIGDTYPKKYVADLRGMTDRLFVFNYQPTCENMLLDFVQRIQPYLPDGVELFSLKLHETANSFAEWYAADNK
ncbi:6-pyruvoyl trahydropterin synthase family protein [Geofilum sp. OHC36d9]|uniref:6-pyruvoyl trahydropterin synthase family protein n=1 Tax=Geofilum sp. OHC36d9 TaxID=3458413 RepID=UPI004034CC57